ncbi:outer membrane receptor protein involved in Fe transport [Hymenobacter luteus]|uniref:Outer membrane receptor protein involved in Fe transport n=2 Tax=Hymenobacter TaxID=89966 RepID=A0A7W9SXK0_9BACT|nr:MULTISPECIES: outer membrane beta-barrel family protein [Hymenobacter]MBB4599928.1 outer membrane receptor protein involved in Fe transport [Hymenobacter latericoloratus]MBB6057762.1 outer membrane receptor protein involved in Fe transport [Hymenobacter luteus]
MKNATLPLLLTTLLTAPVLAQTTPAAGQRPAGAPAGPATAKPVLPTAPRGAGRLDGTVLDATTKKPVEFATIALLPLSGTTPVDGGVCDERGRFSLRNLPAGEFRLQISFVGYATQTRNVTVGAGATTLPPIQLESSAQKLGEVTVTGERDVVETKPDRIVYNADKDLTNTGGTAADVLRKVPLVNVDPDGNVELRGTSNVRVLINNKPSGIVASSVADAMKQIPADQIKSVEVITTPSAKYDAEGTGGIINIILKKNNLEGVNGSVGLAAGTRSSNGNASLNYRKGKVGLTSSVSGFSFYSPNRNDLVRYLKTPGGEEESLRQEGDGNTIGGGGFGRLGLDYDPAQYHNLTLNVQGSLFRNSGNYDQFNNVLLPFANQFTRDTDRRFRTQSYDMSGSYTRTFEQKRREWSVLAQHTRNRNFQDYYLDQFRGDSERNLDKEYREESNNLSRNLETTLQTDYAHPFSETALLETGAKAILRRVSSDYDVFNSPASNGGSIDPVYNPERSNLFDYNQDVLSAYGTYGFSASKKVSFKLGARVENTRIRGSFQQLESQNSGVEQDYFNLLPNLSLSYQPQNPKKPGQTVRLAYSRRIQRPQIFYLNPFRNTSDTLNVSYGNPQLEPELTDSYELNYTTFIKGSVLNLSAYARRTGNAIEAVRFIDRNGVNNQTFRNIGRNATFGVSLFTSVKPLPKWDLSGNVNVYYVSLKSPALTFEDGAITTSAYSNSGVMYNLNLNSSYKFEKGLSVQFFGGLNSPRVQLQGSQRAWTFYSLGLRKNLLKEKADLTLNADNFLQATRNLSSELNTDQFRQISNNYIYLRGVRLAFNYRFGKTTTQPQKRRRSIQNDDVKQGEGGQGQGQQ